MVTAIGTRQVRCYSRAPRIYLERQQSAALEHGRRSADDSKPRLKSLSPLNYGLLRNHARHRGRDLTIIPMLDVMVILYEGNAGIRQIFTDGRALPPADSQPWWYG